MGLKLNLLSIHTSVSMVVRQAVVLVPQAVQVANMLMQEHAACVHPLA